MNAHLLTANIPSSLFNLTTGEDLLWAVLLLIITISMLMILLLTIYLATVLRQMINPETAIETATPKLSAWEKFTGLRPLSHEKELALEHTYDGIVELDNPTPPWFMYLFYSTIGFAAIYLLLFHIIGSSDLQVAEYDKEIAIADVQRQAYITRVAGSINENTVTLVKDTKAIDEGKALFTTYCVACHGAAGQGGVGPNLTDEYWLHGGSVKSVFHTITEGVPEKGMMSWKKQLNPLQVQYVASFILSLQGSKPAGGKEPQGEKEAPALAAQGEKVAVN
ncbi:cbb3-type cytochrome c oxidase N-terminal domain-containing protein [Fibrella forsythiae]|uniref:C-type cytochrome n=1 Tax=Fibrella forsythiae TaxID=2817061 RepID=A0ABS3JHC4_9BACT|nr:cbb3-type cytochrome c oxidase N-terminal domain-containing protein [Fibrella forsythiae]MBO0949410.1 c-type cytochrome [Fibrella forsythiae]